MTFIDSTSPNATLKCDGIALFNFAVANSPGDQLYEHIKAMVTTYRFKPGDRINELALSRQLGVSRTPIRAALNRIAAEGFLTAVSNKGYEMRALDAAYVQALFEYRSNLEVGVVRLVCARATDAELEELSRSVADDHGDPLDDDAAIRFLWRDERFHERLAVLSGNEEFLRAVRTLNERIRFARWIDIKSRIGSMSRDHLRIVTFLQERDLESAEALMQVHVARRIEQIVELTKASYAEMYTNNALAAYAELCFSAGSPASAPE